VTSSLEKGDVADSKGDGGKESKNSQGQTLNRIEVRGLFDSKKRKNDKRAGKARVNQVREKWYADEGTGDPRRGTVRINAFPTPYHYVSRGSGGKGDQNSSRCWRVRR